LTLTFIWKAEGFLSRVNWIASCLAFKEHHDDEEEEKGVVQLTVSNSLQLLQSMQLQEAQYRSAEKHSQYLRGGGGREWNVDEIMSEK
jgi:hypothetical protein